MKEKTKEKADKFLELLKKYDTYREIGEVMGVTKSYVYLLLKTYHKEETKKILKEKNWHRGKRIKTKKQKEFINCLNCGKRKEYLYYKPIFCSHKCKGIFMKYAIKKQKEEKTQ